MERKGGLMQEADERFLSLFRGQRGWDREARTYEPRDDGVHIDNRDDQWEWWYFDFTFDNGYRAVATLHHHNMMLLPHVPTMQLFVYPPEGSPRAKLWALRPGQENFASRQRCQVRMGSLFAEDTGEGFHLAMPMKDMGIDVTIQNLVRGWKAGTGLLWSDPERRLETGWVVAVPRGRAKGTLTVDGKTQEVEGHAYHDHNWGTCEMDEIMRGWYWGRLFDPKYTIIYGWVIPREEGKPVVSPFMLARDREILLSTDNFTLTVEESKRDDRFGWDIPMRLELRTTGPGVEAKGSLNTRRVLEALELPRGKNAYHYYRLQADYRARMRVDGQEDRVSGETIHEVMILE
jgi:hypothetical protein